MDIIEPGIGIPAYQIAFCLAHRNEKSVWNNRHLSLGGFNLTKMEQIFSMHFRSFHFLNLEVQILADFFR